MTTVSIVIMRYPSGYSHEKIIASYAVPEDGDTLYGFVVGTISYGQYAIGSYLNGPKDVTVPIMSALAATTLWIKIQRGNISIYLRYPEDIHDLVVLENNVYFPANQVDAEYLGNKYSLLDILGINSDVYTYDFLGNSSITVRELLRLKGYKYGILVPFFRDIVMQFDPLEYLYMSNSPDFLNGVNSAARTFGVYGYITKPSIVTA